MTDGDVAIKSALEQLFPVSGEPDWDEVISAARRHRAGSRRQLALAVAVAALVAITIVTPLGAEIARGLGGFSNWISGEPGQPAPRSEQQRFARENGRSWLGFPRGTQLRRLIATRSGDATVTLDGFRTGTSAFCLRLSVKGKTPVGTLECAPLADLRRQDAPARVLIADRPVGRGTKNAWYGLDRIHSAHLQITAGIATDAVRAIVLVDEHGRHIVPVHSNAFLYIATDPEVGQRVRTVAAQTKNGFVPIPFVPTPFGFGGIQPAHGAPTVNVTAPALNGHVSWLEKHEPRGEPLSVLPPRLRRYRGGPHSKIIYGRVLTPDPSQPLRIIVTLNASRHGGRPAGICTAIVTKASAGSGCALYPQTFAKTPFNVSWSGAGSGQFNEVAGVASDAVTKISALLANGQTLPAALHDNVFTVAVPVTHLPARLVAYDRNGTVIGASETIGGFGRGANAAPGKAVQILAAKAGVAHAELFVGPATGGGECSYIKTHFSVHAGGMTVSCRPAAWQGNPVQVSLMSEFLAGRVRADVKTIRLDYTHGATTIVHPTRGYVLVAIPAQHRARAGRLVRVVGITSAGRTIALQNIPAPPKKTRSEP
jgi:hypothetical protein